MLGERTRILVGAMTAALSACSGELSTGTMGAAEASLSGPAGLRASTLAVGGDFACVLQNGVVSCSGETAGGGTLTPHRVVGLTNQASIAAGLSTACSVGADGSVYCWGDNSGCELGNQSGTSWFDTPQRVVWRGFYETQPLVDIVQVSVGEHQVCALDTAGAVWCWGNGICAAEKVPSVTALRVTSHCVLSTDHTVSCWQGSTLQKVPFVTNAVEISSSDTFWAVDCALLNDGTVKCWGNNDWDELGNGRDGSYDGTNPFYSWLPTNVVSPDGRTNLSQVTALSHSSVASTMCASTSSGGTYCWGEGYTAGSGSFSRVVDVPVALGSLGGSPAVEVAVGSNVGCARSAAGGLWCWGNNQGEFGDGKINQPTASPIFIRSIQ
jgi:alpha-tubulin suppressor-like RCC1 family protein